MTLQKNFSDERTYDSIRQNVHLNYLHAMIDIVLISHFHRTFLEEMTC